METSTPMANQSSSLQSANQADSQANTVFFGPGQAPPTGSSQPPKETPPTEFVGVTDQDPMRNFGFTVAAYSVIWFLVLGFVLRNWRRQAALENRLADIEKALTKGAQSADKLMLESSIG